MATDTTTTFTPASKASQHQRAWLLLALGVVVVLLIAAARWILAHPYGIHWDEAYYFDEALADIHKLHSGSLRQYASILIGGDPFRPPAYRLLALPFLAIFGFHTMLARFLTLACWVATVVLIYLTSRRLSTPVAGAIAVMVFCLAPEVFSASVFFSTEGPLFLATSAMLYFLWADWSDAPEGKRWIGLGFAVALGLLSKITFVLIAFPVLGLALLLQAGRNRQLLVKELFKAGLLALVIAAPWWIKNIGPASRYSRIIREEARESFGAPSLLTSAKWLGSVVMGLLGPAVTILICVVAVVSIRSIFVKKQAVLKPAHGMAIWASICAAVPLIVLQLSGMNHNLRYLTPLVIPSAIAVGILAEATGWIHSKAGAALCVALVAAQLLMIVTPVAFPKTYPVDPGLVNGGLPWGIMVRFEQWDWRPLRTIAASCDLEKPKISVLGMGRPLNPPQILYPWFLDGTVASDSWFWRYQPVWLWRYSEGPINWEKVMNLTGESDIVVTAPDFVGQVSDKQDQDNRYNREFAERLGADPRFQGPVRLKMGRFQPVEVDVFVKKSAACQDIREERAAR